jgi:hypothetical protein
MGRIWPVQPAHTHISLHRQAGPTCQRSRAAHTHKLTTTGGSCASAPHHRATFSNAWGHSYLAHTHPVEVHLSASSLSTRGPRHPVTASMSVA